MLDDPLDRVSERAAWAEAIGHDGVWTGEAAHDPFFPLVLAAPATERLELITGVAVAFAMNPMRLAYMARDVQDLSGGRFILGLGSQIESHIRHRFDMAWSHPARRMWEFVAALRAIWDAWDADTGIDFRGEFYSHTLMTPMFSPGPAPSGQPRIYLAGVGEAMTELAGEVADGFICHPFTTERYFRATTRPALERGMARAGRVGDQFEVFGPNFVVTGATEEEFAASLASTRRRIAFYASTPAYRPVLELHGWGDLQPVLRDLSRDGQWARMGELIADDMVEEIALVGGPVELADRLGARYGDVIDRISLEVPIAGDRDLWAEVIEAIRDVGTREVPRPPARRPDGRYPGDVSGL